MVEAAKRVFDAVEEPVDRFGLFHIRRNGDRARAQRLDFTDGFIGKIGVAIEVDDDRGALACQRQRESAPDPARATRDERDLIFEAPPHAPDPPPSSARAMMVF